MASRRAAWTDCSLDFRRALGPLSSLPVWVPAPFLPLLLLLACLCPTWCGGLHASMRTKEERPLLPLGLGCDMDSSSIGATILRLRACILSCLVITPLDVEIWEAGFGVEVSHGLLLAKVWGGRGVAPSPPSTPPAWNVK